MNKDKPCTVIINRIDGTEEHIRFDNSLEARKYLIENEHLIWSEPETGTYFNANTRASIVYDGQNRYEINLDELDRAYRDFAAFVEANGGWNYGEIPILDSFFDFIERGDCCLEPRDND